MDTEKELWNSRDEQSGLNSGYLQKFRLYETRSKFYMIGRDKNRTLWRVLKIDRLEPSELNIIEDSTTYSENECFDLLRRIHEGNRSTGGLKFVTTCYGIVGFVKFLGPYYMLLITKRRKIGAICGHTIYAITKSEMIPVPNSTVQSNMANSKNENRSFVHFACKCKMSLVLLRGYKILVLQCVYVFRRELFYTVVVLYDFNYIFSLSFPVNSTHFIRRAGNLCTSFVNKPFKVILVMRIMSFKVVSRSTYTFSSF